MLKLMGKNIFTIFAKKFCLYKPVRNRAIFLINTLVNVYVDLVVFTRIAGTLKTGSGRYWP